MWTLHTLVEYKSKIPEGEEIIHDTSNHPKETDYNTMMKAVLDDIDEEDEDQNEE